MRDLLYFDEPDAEDTELCKGVTVGDIRAWYDEMERLRDATELRALFAQYVLMPREATRSMTMAGCDSLPSCEHVFGYAGEMLRNAYRKMVEVGALK
jgi:hypothetical protein